jgi:hypothetical protein
VAAIVAAVDAFAGHYRDEHDREVTTGEAMAYLYTRFRGQGELAPQTLAWTGAVMAEVLAGSRDATTFVEAVRSEMGKYQDFPAFRCDDPTGHRVTVRLADGSVVEARIAGGIPGPLPPQAGGGDTLRFEPATAVGVAKPVQKPKNARSAEAPDTRIVNGTTYQRLDVPAPGQ